MEKVTKEGELNYRATLLMLSDLPEKVFSDILPPKFSYNHEKQMPVLEGQINDGYEILMTSVGTKCLKHLSTRKGKTNFTDAKNVMDDTKSK